MSLNYRKVLSKKQLISYGTSNKKWNVWEGAVRSGKTVATIWRWILYIATAPPGALIMIGYTSSSLYRNVIEPMQELLGDQMRYYPSKQIVVLFGRKIHCLYAKNSDAAGRLRGLTCAGCLGDEITLWHPSVFHMLQSRLSVPGAKAFLTTNPDSPFHWFKKDFLDIKKIQPYLNRYVFRLEDNEWLMRNNPGYIEELKSGYKPGSLHYLRFIEGLWTMAEGIIYDMFEENIHIVDDSCDIPHIDNWFVSVDYGTQNPCVFLLIGESSDYLGRKTYWILDEYWYCGREKGKQKSPDTYAKDMKKWLDGIEPYNIYVDPSEAAFIQTLREKGLTQTKKADNDVSNGIKLYSIMLNKNRVKIHKRCKNFIQEHGVYIWNPKSFEDEPLKENDHSMDAVRYFFNTRVGYSKMYDIEKLVA